MPDYVPTGRHVFSGRNRIDNEMVSLTPDPAIIAAPTEEELNIVPLEGHEVDDSDEIMEEEEFVDESQIEKVRRDAYILYKYKVLDPEFLARIPEPPLEMLHQKELNNIF